MQDISRPWDWSKNTQDFWNSPSEEAYFLVNRWKGKDYKSFLDLGCGLGRHSLLFAQNEFKVNAFDLSEEAVTNVRKRSIELGLSQNMVFVAGDMKELPYKDEFFDCILAYHVISHTDTQGIKQILRELTRVLRKGGEVYITLCSKKAWSFQEAGYPKYDENTVIKKEDGPEDGIPHFYADDVTVKELLKDYKLLNVRHIQDMVIDGSELKNSWHYFVLGEKK